MKFLTHKFLLVAAAFLPSAINALKLTNNNGRTEITLGADAPTREEAMEYVRSWREAMKNANGGEAADEFDDVKIYENWNGVEEKQDEKMEWREDREGARRPAPGRGGDWRGPPPPGRGGEWRGSPPSSPPPPGREPGRPERPERPGRPERPERPERPDPRERPGSPTHRGCWGPPIRRTWGPSPPAHCHGRAPPPPPPPTHLEGECRGFDRGFDSACGVPSQCPSQSSTEWPPHRPTPPDHGIHKDETIYELLEKSKYTTKLFELIKKDEDLSKLLKSTDKNITFFAPTDKAFENLPHPPPHHNGSHSMSKEEFIKKALLYHAAPGLFGIKELFGVNTIASYLKNEDGIGKDEAQRLRISGFGHRINTFAKIIAGNIFAKNGVVHALDNFIILPPPAETIVEVVPAIYSTTAFALRKTGLYDSLPEGPKTFFAPTNNAWARLGFKINAFLFSKFGEKYLAALLKYHVVPGTVIYSDYQVIPKKDGDDKEQNAGYFHADLPTLLGDKKIIVDIYTHGQFVKWRLNGGVPIVINDVIARDGVIQSPFRVLIPYHKHGGADAEAKDPFYMLGENIKSDGTFEKAEVKEAEEELTVEKLKELLEPFV